MKTIFRVVILLVAFLAPVVFAGPYLVFNDASFDYSAHEVAYLHFSRDGTADVLTVDINTQQEPDGLPFYIGKLSPGLTREEIYQQLGIKVTEQAFEFMINEGRINRPELLDYFHDLAPKLGFNKEQELFGGNTYIFACGCEVNKDTHFRVSFKPNNGFTLIRLELQTPAAY